jgi:phage shock protein A
MGVFSRFADIVTANISAMLDRAEEPEKMIRLMIREMEETLVEIKAGCASSMAKRTHVGRQLDDARRRVDVWQERARLAVDKGREDLAREALIERRNCQDRVDALEGEAAEFDALIEQARDDIGKLEEKLRSAQEKQRILLQRHRAATARKRAQQDIRRAEGAEAVVRFEQFEQRIERMEAEAALVNPPRRGSLDAEFALLEGSDDIEKELEALKQGRKAPEKKGTE